MNERSPHGAAKSVRRGQRQRKMRAQQQRALATRAAILNAAIAEFAERGFEGASIRRIADRTGLQHPLITYHYRSKDILWRAAAEHAFTRIREEWDLRVPEQAPLSTLERLREEYRAVFQYTAAFPEFPQPPYRPLASPNQRGPKRELASEGRAHPFPLYDGESHRDAFRIRARDGSGQRFVAWGLPSCRSLLASG